MSITVDEKYLKLPVTRSDAIHEFLHERNEVLAIAREITGKIYAVQFFMPKHHSLQDLKSKDFENAEWYLYPR